MRITSLVLEAGYRRSSRLKGSDHLTWSRRRQLSRLLRKIRSGQGQTGLNCAEPSLPDLAFSPWGVPLAAETLVGTLHLTAVTLLLGLFLAGWVGGSKMLSGRTPASPPRADTLLLSDPFLLWLALAPFEFFISVVRLVDKVVGGAILLAPAAGFPLQKSRFRRTGNLTLVQEDENRLTSVGGWMSQVVPPPESDHSNLGVGEGSSRDSFGRSGQERVQLA